MEKSVFRVIKDVQVNTPESMQTIQPGKEIKISCVDFAPYGTVKSAATRLNQRVGWTEFSVETPDNGATIIIKRNIKL